MSATTIIQKADTDPRHLLRRQVLAVVEKYTDALAVVHASDGLFKLLVMSHS